MPDITISQGAGSRAAARDYYENLHIHPKENEEPHSFDVLKSNVKYKLVVMFFGIIAMSCKLLEAFYPKYAAAYFGLFNIFAMLTIVSMFYIIIKKKFIIHLYGDSGYFSSKETGKIQFDKILSIEFPILSYTIGKDIHKAVFLEKNDAEDFKRKVALYYDNKNLQ